MAIKAENVLDICGKCSLVIWEINNNGIGGLDINYLSNLDLLVFLHIKLDIRSYSYLPYACIYISILMTLNLLGYQITYI
jgi:hypothetical protein